MVQNVANQTPVNYGSVTRIGMTDNGRVVYQVVDPTGQGVGKMSLPQAQCDVFEKSYKDLMETAPKIQNYMQTTSPEKMKKKQSLAKWIVAGCTAIGAGIPLIKAKGEGGKGTLKKIGLTLLGSAVGLAVGIFTAAKATTPPGAQKFAKATQKISSLDIQPVQE